MIAASTLPKLANSLFQSMQDVVMLAAASKSSATVVAQEF